MLFISQSVTSRLETSRYRDFSQFFESIGLGLENFGLEKKSRYRSRKYLVSKKSLGIGLDEIFWSHHSVSNTTSDPESALHNISQEIAALQAQLMERDIDRIHQESESRIEDMKAEKKVQILLKCHPRKRKISL